jgi:hypothetical protein
MSDIVVIIPRVTLNTDGTIKNLSWTYQMADGSNPVDPSNSMRLIHINASSSVPITDCGSSQNCDPYGYGTVFAYPSASEIDLSSKKISWDTLGSLYSGYTDIYSNYADFKYRR